MFQVFAGLTPVPIVSNELEATNTIEAADKPFNIFEYIGRPTAEREARHKVDGGDMKKMGKMDALRILMSIAGDHWEKDLLMGSHDDVSNKAGGASG